MFKRAILAIKNIKKVINGNMHNQINILQSRIDNQYEVIQKLNKIILDTRNTLSNIVDIGVDVHLKSSNSWAVVCIGGNIQRIEFLDLDRTDIEHIREFLSRYKVSNKCIDAHPSMYNIFKYKELI